MHSVFCLYVNRRRATRCKADSPSGAERAKLKGPRRDGAGTIMENSNIAWTHNTQNFWLGCDKIAPECAHCYIGRVLQRQGREPWGQLYRTKTWREPFKWQREAEAAGVCRRVFTNSLSDFFHADA